MDRNMIVIKQKKTAILLFLWLFLTSSLFAKDKAIIVFDASGSMWSKIDGKTKITVAKDTLKNLVNNWDEKKALGLLAYGHRKKGDCNDIQTLVPVGKVDKKAMISMVEKINPKGKTPISAAIKIAADELKFTEDNATIILISDGKETCNADPCKTAAELEKLGVNFTAHVIGFDVDEETGKQLKCIAKNTGGQYLPADNAEQLNEALERVTKQLTTLTIKAIDENGNELNEEIEWKIINRETKEIITLNGNGARENITIKSEVDNKTDDQNQKNEQTIIKGKWLVSGSSKTLSGEQEVTILGSRSQLVKVRMNTKITNKLLDKQLNKEAIITNTLFNVETTVEITDKIDGVIDVDKVSVKYELDTKYKRESEVVTLTLEPTIKQYSKGIETLAKRIPGSWSRIYTSNGNLTDLKRDKGAAHFNWNTQNIFSIGYLMLPVNDNDQLKQKWLTNSFYSSLPMLEEIEITITSLTDTEIGVDFKNIPSSSSKEIVQTLSGSGIYDRKTLLLKKANVKESLTVKNKVKRNGIEMEIEKTQHLHFVIKGGQS